MNINERFMKMRFAILYPFGLLLLIFAIPDDNSMRFGMVIIALGILIRLWANCYAIKNDKLTTLGPYAFVRNPLYLGSMLLAIGFVIMLKFYYVGLPFLLILFYIYSNTIKKEEGMLIDKFKDAYFDYKKQVPAIMPTLIRYNKGEKWPPSLKRLFKSGEYKLVIWLTIISIIFYLKKEFIVEHARLDARLISLIVVAVILGAIDFIVEPIRKKSPKY